MGAALRFASFLTVLHQRPIPPLARQARTGEIMRVSILLLSLLVVLAVLSYAEAGKKKKKPVPGPCKVANCKQCNVSGKKCKKCNDGFKPQKKGKKCGPKPCEPNPCENGGKCIFNKKKKVEVCKCPELTAGDRCELRAEVLPPPEPEPEIIVDPVDPVEPIIIIDPVPESEIIVDPVDPEPPAPNLAVPWRDDLRCGPNFKLPSGENAQCDPNNKNGHVCCSPQGWCGKTPAHCTCDGCIDYSPKPVPRPLPKPGSSCPASHPYVYHDGDYCCASNTEKVYAPEGERCDGGPISFTSSCCKDDQYVACSTNICSNNGQDDSKEGWGFIESQSMPGMCIDVDGLPGMSNGADIHLWSCEKNMASTSDQVWKRKENGQVVSRPSGKCMDIVGFCSNLNLLQIHLWECEAPGFPNSDHFWDFEYHGDYFRIKNKCTGKCVDVDGWSAANNGQNIHQWSCENWGQRDTGGWFPSNRPSDHWWKFVPVTF